MEVDRVSFPHRLLGVLTALSESHFVSLDLEFSGIASRPSGGQKQTLEDRYKETKAAAEKFQILQVGLTCVRQDYPNEVYTARPYNFNISPLIEDSWGVDRIFAFQSGACQFLLKHGFHMELPFTTGVGYLSRDEAELAKKLAYDRLDKGNIKDIVLKESETQSLAFVKNVRCAITKWQKNGMRSSLHITSNTGQDIESGIAQISNFEKRLVHQLVRAEFPKFVTMSKPDYIQVIPLDEEKEASWRNQRKKKIKEQIATQTGFRWVVEAMSGGDLSRLDPLSFAQNASGNAEYVDLQSIKGRFFRAREALRGKPRILVGHNMFTDLIYFYRAFIGTLPDTLAEFQRTIHGLFPVIVDTKYMATHECGDISPFSSLEQIEEGLRRQRVPTIRIHEDHNKYVTGTDSFHEAGYDSLLTANIMIRLSAKLECAGTYLSGLTLSDDDLPYETAPEDNGVSLRAEHSTGLAKQTASNNAKFGTPSPAIGVNGVSISLVPSSVGPQGSSGKKKKKKKTTPEKTKDQASSRFATRTMFDQLRIEEAEELEPNHTSPSWDIDGPAQSYEGLYPLPEKEKKAPMVVMPPFDSDFWLVYGNKLRVFGTEEGVLELTG